MRFVETKLAGLFVVEMELREDERGFFARSWCRDEFAVHGLKTEIIQCNVSFNRKTGTLRGMHYQAAPHGEAKLVRCTAGAIYDVAVDIRPLSPTFQRWEAVELTAANWQMLYIPEGFAHGFLTLEDDTEVSYQMFERYHPESARGLRWNDPAFGINWPAMPERILSERDASYALFNSAAQ